MTQDPDSINPYTKNAYSETYYSLLRTRQELPVFKEKENIVRTVLNNKVVIIEGSTGSGKTTQIPQFLLEAFASDLNTGQMIACTQPRQVAAINVASRVSKELDVPLGTTVGYAVRFDKKVSKSTRLKYMTDGLLLNEFVTDHNVSNYRVVIIDEAHERNVNTDILLGLLKQLIHHRHDLNVIIMSATIDTEKFVNFFDGAPKLSVPGTAFDVEVIYSSKEVVNYQKAALEKVLEIHTTMPPGHILLFMTGEDEINHSVGKIKDMISNTRKTQGANLEYEVLPIYSKLSPDQQAKIFDPPATPTTRKIIVATNIAETSITIDGIVYVIDTGRVKQTSYDPLKRRSSLQTVVISQASADQRKGRAGRTQPGKCYRLFTEDFFQNQMTRQTIPEIQRADLGQVALRLIATGITDFVHFPFLDPPHYKLVASALEELYYLGAITDEGRLTEDGHLFSILPVEPKYSACLIEAKKIGCLNEVASLVSVLTEGGDIFKKDKKEPKLSDEAHRPFISQTSDHFTIVKTFEAYFDAVRRSKNKDESFEWCRAHYIDSREMYRARQSRQQIIDILSKEDGKGVLTDVAGKNSGLSDKKREKLILQALLKGFFMQAAFLHKNAQKYVVLMSQGEAGIHPKSNVKIQSEWLMYDDYNRGESADSIRTVSVIKPKWLYSAAPDFFYPPNFENEDVRTAVQELKEKYEKTQNFR